MRVSRAVGQWEWRLSKGIALLWDTRQKECVQRCAHLSDSSPTRNAEDDFIIQTHQISPAWISRSTTLTKWFTYLCAKWDELILTGGRQKVFFFWQYNNIKMCEKNCQIYTGSKKRFVRGVIYSQRHQWVVWSDQNIGLSEEPRPSDILLIENVFGVRPSVPVWCWEEITVLRKLLVE